MKVLVIGAHADDPEVSMGGTIAKFTRLQHETKILIAIIPCEGRDGVASEKRKEERWVECENSAKILGAEIEILDLNPYEMLFTRDLVKLLDKKIMDFSPDIVYTHWNHDSHQDHIAIANATFAATRKNNVSLLMYEQLTLGGITPYSFNSNIFVDISDVIGIKMESVKVYKSQKLDERLKAIYGLATFRGNQIGVKYAESFEAVRTLLDINKNGCSLYGFWESKKKSNLRNLSKGMLERFK